MSQIVRVDSDANLFGTTLPRQQSSEKQVIDAPVVEPEVIVDIKNIHKTYLLGVEGVPALRYNPPPPLLTPAA
jgi:hypothetical protein